MSSLTELVTLEPFFYFSLNQTVSPLYDVQNKFTSILYFHVCEEAGHLEQLIELRMK